VVKRITLDGTVVPGGEILLLDDGQLN
jgi:hypothetical protein